ncbi:hypothetical protein NEOLEDRAFT_1182864 [Neolentinus lepideus HHB14362 ss-1]|uniref:Actin-like ATPase domain-containing protein n=1 Tax=Neolentinus lepideus HHB14362 ss-1 TaxID=1314782 RepID=A0A165NSB2_9AGAM|nr:hypothetical protein NEOLEDRAFT_1182864 [Neolentinus lepideus HHB14362 ss-1]
MSEKLNSRKPYEGKGRRLVVAIDVGTTFTAASSSRKEGFLSLRRYGNLQIVRIHCFGFLDINSKVLRWLRQTTADAKVPPVLYYDKQGRPQAFAAETDDEDVIMEAESNEWYKATWWKLLLRPGHLPLIKDIKLLALPVRKSVEDVFADLCYIKTQIREYVTTTYGGGGNIWTTLSPTMYVILTTPNGWEGAQQNKTRAAAIKAELVDAQGARRIKFVTEAEAAILYAVDSGYVNDWLAKDDHLILCDCGGGTVDITLVLFACCIHFVKLMGLCNGYRIKELSPLRLEESSASRCYLAGAVFITQAAREYLKLRLSGTEWDNEEALQRATDDFDKNAKRKVRASSYNLLAKDFMLSQFDNPDGIYWINLDGFKSIADLGVVRGRLKVTGEDMVKLFKPSIKCIKEGLEIAFENGNQLADKIILAGGLARSPYVYSQLVKWGEENGIPVSRPDGLTTKAVANGAIAWHVDDSISARVSKYHYGVNILIPYDPACAESKKRSTYMGRTGNVLVPQAWSCILPKNESMETIKVFNKPFVIDFDEAMNEPNDHFKRSVVIYVYRRAKAPKFITFPGKNTLQPGYEKLCTVTGDLRQPFKASPTSVSPTTGIRYREVSVRSICSFPFCESSDGWLRLKENNEWVYGEATVAYE